MCNVKGVAHRGLSPNSTDTLEYFGSTLLYMPAPNSKQSQQLSSEHFEALSELNRQISFPGAGVDKTGLREI